VTARRRRGLLLLSVALASGGLAASQVAERERKVEERVGPLVPVLVAARDLAPGARVTARALAVRRVPAHFVPPDAIGSAAEVTGARTAVPLGAGSYLTAGQLEPAAGSGPGAAGSQLGPGERAVEVGVSGGGMLEALAPGTRVDVVVSTEPGAGGGVGRTLVALADVQLLALRGDPAAGAYAAAGNEPSPAPAALATLRVTLRQAVHLTAADNFGREIRLLARPPGDRTRAAVAAVSAGDL
jgi:pilus assembly protein CpaB